MSTSACLLIYCILRDSCSQNSGSSLVKFLLIKSNHMSCARPPNRAARLVMKMALSRKSEGVNPMRRKCKYRVKN